MTLVLRDRTSRQDSLRLRPLGDKGPGMGCNNCGAINPASAHYCGNCGWAYEPLVDEDVDPPRPEPAMEGPVDRTQWAPRSLSELLLESVRLYVKNPAVFLGIGLIPQLPGLLGLGPLPMWWAVTLVITSLVITALTFGAIIHAVVTDYLGLTPTVASSYSRAWDRVVSLEACLLAHLVLVGTSLLLSLVLVGIPMLLVLLVALWFYPQTIMVENQDPVTAFRRSVALVRGNWLRVFGIGVVYWALPVALAMAVLPFSNDPANSMLVGIYSAVVGTITTPWILIGSTLTYLDLRVRKEGYSLESLEAELKTPTPP